MTEIGKFPNGLREAMNAREIGPTALGRMADIPKQDIDRWAKQERRLTPEVAAKLAPHLNTTPNRLLLLPEPPSRPKTTTIVGRAGAATDGKVIMAEGQGGLGTVTVPEGASEESKAIEIEGYSMGVLADGALVFYTEVHSAPTDDMLGLVVVVGTSDGSVLLKKLLRGSSKGLYDLESINGPTLRDQQVIWAAHIDSLVPPWRAKRLRIETFEDVVM
jgi:hypothetical protein